MVQKLVLLSSEIVREGFLEDFHHIFAEELVKEQHKLLEIVKVNGSLMFVLKNVIDFLVYLCLPDSETRLRRE